MTFLIIGTHNSGKSALAEDLALKTKDARRYYFATMRVLDDEGKKRVEKHRRQREGEGFITKELPYGIAGVLNKIEEPKEATVLLECMSNLVGNKLHDELSAGSVPDSFTDEVISDIKSLAEGVGNLIIVTDEYAEEEGYDEETLLYIRLLSSVNGRLKLLADETIDLNGKG